jgi:plastocyanin
MPRIGWLAGLLTIGAGVAQAQGAMVAVAGRVTLLERSNKPSRDLGNTVVWLESTAPQQVTPGRFDVVISDKTYVPRVLVLPAGSTLRFPNHDPFNHNVFSVSDSNAFDLGLFGRGEAKQTVLRHPGLVRIFCNVHPRMVAYAVVTGSPHAALAGSDGSFRLEGIAPGRYRLHLWHERVPGDTAQGIVVPPAGLMNLAFTLDARGYRWQQHKNKTGQDYTSSGRERY